MEKDEKDWIVSYDCNDEMVTESEVHDALVDYNRLYTYSDYIKWDDDKRRELIDGVPYLMSMPVPVHQKISVNLTLIFGNYLKGKPCELYHPLDVRLNADTIDNTVVQPDLIIVCDHSIVDNASIKGVPDMVVEILSPSTERYDKTTKFNKYLESGVREYWIVDPKSKTLAVNVLDDSKYITYAYNASDIVKVHVLEGCVIDLTEVFTY